MHHFSTKDTNTRLYVLRKHALFKKALKGAQSMLDAGCAALLEDKADYAALLEAKAGCTALPEDEEGFTEAATPLYMGARLFRRLYSQEGRHYLKQAA